MQGRDTGEIPNVFSRGVTIAMFLSKTSCFVLMKFSRYFGRMEVFSFVFWLANLTVWGVVAYSLKRGIGLNDESWYLVLLRDRVAVPGSSWNLFFAWLPDDLVVIRLATVGMLFVGCMVFGCGVVHWLNNSFDARPSKYSRIVVLFVPPALEMDFLTV